MAISKSIGAETALTLLDALNATLASHPLLHIQQQQVESSRGVWLRAQSQFDRAVLSTASLGRTYQPLDELERIVYGASSSTTNLASVDISATQQFRNGISATPDISITRTTDNVATQFGTNQSHVGMQINIPLLKGRGRSVVTAQEAASRVEVDASILDLNQTASDLLFNTAVAYWSTIATKRSLEVYREAEARGKVLLETVEALIEADRRPRGDISDAQANLADRTASRIAAEQQVLQAKQQLGIAMGLDAAEIFTAPDPADELPTGPADLSSDTFSRERAQALVAEALVRRFDLLAADKRKTEAETLAAAAKNQLKPQLDLQLATGYSGLRDGTRPDQYLISPFVGVHGLDAIGGVHYQFAPANRAAQGNLLRAQSNLSEASYRRQDLARNIASSVLVAAAGVNSAIGQLGQVNESVANYRTALDNQREKYRLGVGSLVEMFTVEDRLTGLLVSQAQAQLNYAVALAKLRQATGSILDATGHADPGVFLTVPEQ